MLGIMAVMDQEDFYMLVVGLAVACARWLVLDRALSLVGILRRVGLRLRGGWCSQC